MKNEDLTPLCKFLTLLCKYFHHCYGKSFLGQYVAFLVVF